MHPERMIPPSPRPSPLPSLAVLRGLCALVGLAACGPGAPTKDGALSAGVDTEDSGAEGIGGEGSGDGADGGAGEGGTGDDGAGDGAPTNAAPGAATVQLSPERPTTSDDLRVNIVAAAVDPEGDPVSYRYRWSQDGVLRADLNGDTVPASVTTKGETWRVSVVATDGARDGGVAEAEAVVINTAPTASISLPATVVEGSDLVAVVEGADADGDPLGFALDWTVDGAVTGWAEATVPASALSGGQRWRLTVRPSDDEAEGEAVFAEVVVERACGAGDVTRTAAGVELVTVCGGAFDMGCTPGQTSCADDEAPVRPTTLSHDYHIGRTEVTQGQFLALMGYNPSYFSGCGADCPVENVSWHEAAAFANAASASAGLPDCYTCTGSGPTVSCSSPSSVYSCAGFRLPTEAEWEGAARCGDDLLYAGSDAIDAVAWYSVNSGSVTHPTANLAPNACGLYDMSGNLWEWVNDGYSATEYSGGAATDPVGDASSAFRVVRGGAWHLDALSNRVALRNSSRPTQIYPVVGLRLVQTAP